MIGLVGHQKRQLPGAGVFRRACGKARRDRGRQMNAKPLLVPGRARPPMVESSDDLATKLDVEYDEDALDALLKGNVV